MDILFVTPSLVPFNVESGPAEACAALSKTLRAQGHRVTVLAPYPEEQDTALTHLARRLDPLMVDIGGQLEAVKVYDGRSSGGVEWLLVEHAGFADLFEDGPAALVGQLVLAKAAVALLARDHSHDTVHAHGEEAALACALIALERRLPTVFSAYSLAKPLCFAREQARKLGLDALLQPDGSLCPILSAIACARRVTTHAPTRTLRAQNGSEESVVASALLARGADLSSLPFGLDASIWNPLTCQHLVARYTPVDLTGKARNKSMLQHELKLDIDPDVALIGAIEGEIGAERIERIARDLVRTDMQMVVQILDEDAECIDQLIALSERMPHRLQVRIGDSQLRMHRIVSASDALLLAADRPVLAMAAQRYGTLPIARRDSISAETVIDIDPKLATGSGVLYDDRSSEALLAGVRRAVAAFNRGRPFEDLRPRLMGLDHSWERAARAAEHVYAQAAEIQAA
jgi:starch synthase